MPTWELPPRAIGTVAGGRKCLRKAMLINTKIRRVITEGIILPNTMQLINHRARCFVMMRLPLISFCQTTLPKKRHAARARPDRVWIGVRYLQ
jgi:hypothetical protein